MTPINLEKPEPYTLSRYLVAFAVFESAAKVSLLPVHLGMVHDPGVGYICKLLVLNGLPLILFWYALRNFVPRWVLLFFMLLTVDLFCYISSAKIRILNDPLLFSDVLYKYNVESAIDVRDAAMMVTTPMDYLSFLDVLVPFVAWKYLWKCERNRKAGLAAVSALAVFVSGNYVDLKLKPFDFKYKATPMGLIDTQQGPLYTFAYSAYELLKQDKAPSREEVKEAVDYLSKIEGKSPDIIQPGYRPNVIIILEESMGRVAVEAPALKRAGRDATPFVNKLMRDRDTVLASFIHSPTRLGSTVQCEFEVLNSCLALWPKGGLIYIHDMDKDYMALPRLMKEQGYYTAVFQPMPSDEYNCGNAYRRLGFELQFSREDQRPGREVGMGLSDEDYFAQVAERLRKLPEPYFAFILTLSGHAPFVIPDDLKTGVTKGMPELAPRASDYLEAISYADRCLKGFFEKTEDIRKRSVVVVFGDHQGIQGRVDLGKVGYDVKTEYQEMMLYHQVPVVISAPPYAGRVKRASGVVGDESDIVPTLLDILGMKKPGFYIGRSMLRERPTGTVSFHNIDYIVDDRRICYLTEDKDTVFDYKCGGRLDPGKADALFREGDAGLTVSEDILLGRRYAYEFR